MNDKRLFLALAATALLAACNDAPTDDSRAASGEVLEGTVSDAMLPLDRVQSEPPFEDPDAFAEAQEKAAGPTSATSTAEAAGDDAEGEAGETPEAPAAEPAAETAG